VSNFRSTQQVQSWVIFQAVAKGVASGAHGVCEQAEWDEMELLCPGRQWIIQSGIASEGVAERLARGTRGDRVPKLSGRKLGPPVTV
jgi:hypothetical protein